MAPKKKNDGQTHLCKIAGIQYDDDFVTGLDQNAPQIAGCLGLNDTLELWQLYNTDLGTKDVMKRYCEHRRARYGAPASTPDSKLAVKPSLMDLAYDSNLQAAIYAPTRPVIGQGGVTEDTLANVTTVWFAIRLMEGKASLFSKSRLSQNPAVIDRHDLLHAWKTLAWIWRLYDHRRIPKKPRRDAAQAPVYYQNARNSPSPTTVNPPAQPTSEEIFGLSTEEVVAYWEAVDRTVGENTDICTNFARELGGQITNALDASRRQKYIRPEMDAGDRQQLLRRFMVLDKFTEKCVRYEPSDTSVPDTSDSLNSLKRLVAASEAISMQEIVANDGKVYEDADLDSDVATKIMQPKEPKLQSLSATTFSFADACKRLKLNPDRPEIHTENTTNTPPLTLKPWQATAVAWMQQQKTPVGGGILGDDCGLGKTTSTLSLVYADSISKARITGHRHRPTLVVCPAPLVETWMSEIEARFGDAIRVCLFRGAREHVSDLKRKSVIVEKHELPEMLANLDGNDPKTSRTIVLSSYSSWSRRTTRPLPTEDHSTEKNSRPKAVGDGSQKTALKDKEDSISSLADAQENDSEAGKPKKSGNKQPQFTSNMGGFFHRVLLDEGHSVKTIRTRYHASIALLDAPHIWIISATPLFNKSLDICGYLALLHKNELDAFATIAHGSQSESDDPVEEYRAFSQMKTLPKHKPWHLLSPKKFAALATRGHLSARQGYHALPIVMRLICLARRMGDPVDPHDTNLGLIGDEIPNMRVMTIELLYPGRLQKEHNSEFMNLLVMMQEKSSHKPKALGNDGSESHGFLDWGVYRLMNHVGFSPILHRFMSRATAVNTLVSNVNKYVEREDRGFSMLWQHVEENPQNLMPTTRVAAAYWLGMDTPKLRYLLRIFQNEGMFDNSGESTPPRFLLFVQWPLVLWLVELFLEMLSIRYVVIRSSMNDQQRQKAASYFNDRGSRCQVLLTTYSCGSLGLNLHHACAHAVLLEPSINLNAILQALGRLARMGQDQKQKVWILFQDRTVSAWAEANSIRKAIPQVAGEIHDIIKPIIDNGLMAQAEGSGSIEEEHDGSLVEQEKEKSHAEESMVYEFAAERLREILGQSSTRDVMIKIDEVCEKAVPVPIPQLPRTDKRKNKGAEGGKAPKRQKKAKKAISNEKVTVSSFSSNALRPE